MSLKSARNEIESMESRFKEKKYDPVLLDNYIEQNYIESVLASLEALRVLADNVDEMNYIIHWKQVLFFLDVVSRERTPMTYNPRLPERSIISKQETARAYLERMFDANNTDPPPYEGYPAFVKTLIKNLECVFEGYRLLFIDCKRSIV